MKIKYFISLVSIILALTSCGIKTDSTQNDVENTKNNKPVASEETDKKKDTDISEDNGNDKLSYEEILQLHYGGGPIVDAIKTEETGKRDKSAVFYKVISAHYYISEDYMDGARVYEVEITKVNDKINGLDLKVGDKIKVFYGNFTYIITSKDEFDEIVQNGIEMINISNKKYYEIPLIKKYNYEIISSLYFNYEGNIFCKEGEEYAGFLYNLGDYDPAYGDYYPAFYTYPLNNAEEVMKAHEEVYSRGCVETVVGEKMIGIVEGTIEEEDLKK